MGCKQRLLNTVHVQSYLECHPCGNNGSCVSKWLHVEGYSRVGVVRRTVLYIIWSIAPLERRNQYCNVLIHTHGRMPYAVCTRTLPDGVIQNSAQRGLQSFYPNLWLAWWWKKQAASSQQISHHECCYSLARLDQIRFDCHHIRNTAYVYPQCHPALLLLYRIQSQVELPTVRVANPAAVILLLDRILLVHHTVHHTSWPVPSQFSSDAAILLVQYTT